MRSPRTTEAFHAAVKMVVEEVSFKDWIIRYERSGRMEFEPVVQVRAIVPDRDNPETHTLVISQKFLSWTLDELYAEKKWEEFRALILRAVESAVCELWMHEFNEFFKVNGERIHDPHKRPETSTV